MRYVLCVLILLIVGCNGSIRIVDYGEVPTDPKELANFVKNENSKIKSLEAELSSRKEFKEDLMKFLENETDKHNRITLYTKIDMQNSLIENTKDELVYRQERVANILTQGIVFEDLTEEKAEVEYKEF